MTTTVTDGRIARSVNTRSGVVDALYELFSEGVFTPTIKQIADRVGVTPRSVYIHFPDRDAIAVALAERQMARHRRLFEALPFTGTLAERIDGIVGHRAELFEVVAPVRRAVVAVIHLSAELQAQQSWLTSQLRRQVGDTFAQEISDNDRPADRLELLDLHTSWETWDRLRRTQKLSVDRCQQLVRTLVEGALRPANALAATLLSGLD